MATCESPLRVLVLDHQRDSLDSMSLLLSWWGHQPHLARASSLLEQARAIRPDLTLVDVATPEWDGWGLARQLRREETLSAMRLVAIAGGGDETQRGLALEAGYDELLTRPVGATQLQGLLARVAERITATRERVELTRAIARETRDLTRRVKERHGIVTRETTPIEVRIEKSGISRLLSTDSRTGAEAARHWLRSQGCRVGPLFETGAAGQTGFFVYSKRLALRELLAQSPLFKVR